MNASVLYQLGNRLGLLYATDNAGTTFYITGISNSPTGVNTLKTHALTRAGIAYNISAQGSYTFTAVSAPDTITDFTVNGISIIDVASPIVVDVVLEADAQALADAINAYTPVSGSKYMAFAVGATTYFYARASYGSLVDGHVVLLSQGVGNITGTAVDIAGGSDGSGAISSVNGARYWFNPNSSAVVGSLTGATEITPYIVMKGLQSQMTTYEQTIASSSITALTRNSQISVVNAGASGATNLDSISGEPAINDIIILKNTSAYTVTVRDLSLSSGNILMSPTSFAMVDESYNMILQYVNHSTYGNIWMEVHRTPMSLAADQVLTANILDLNVTTAKINDLAVTTAKINDLAVTTAKINDLAVTTAKIDALAVTTAKIDALAVTTAQIALLAVDSAQLADSSVITAKIADAGVTVVKLDDAANTDIFTVPVKFATGYYGQVKVELPWNCEIIKVSAAVTYLIEATDDATVICKDQALASMGQIDLTAAAPVGNSFTLSPTSNNSFLANETMTFETSKSTDGGEALITIHLLKTP